MNSLPPKTSEEIDDFNRQASAKNLLAVKMTPFYRKKVIEEIAALGNSEGPLSRCVIPTREKLELRAPGEVADFVEDRVNMPASAHHTIVQKYRDRLLFLPAETCAAHCQYCFRTNVLTEQRCTEQLPLEAKIDQLIDYLGKHPEVEEVILSGGDPLTISADKLNEILGRIKAESKIKNIRAHTRALVYAPQLFTQEKCRALADSNVRLVHHIVHPYEICGEVRSKIRQLQNHGIRSYNQFPLLRRINDHSQVLKKLLKELDELSVRNISIFIPDPIDYSATFRIPLKRIFGIMDDLNWNTPSWLNSTRLVLDTVHGKVRRENLKHFDPNTGAATFEREGKNIIYKDLPEDLDQPGNIGTLLWKE
jgi:lysine 2,3-aminomutase